MESTTPSLGIAANYPGDKNIGSDPDVILADDFESYNSVSGLSAKWLVQYPDHMRIATEAGTHYSGSKAVEMSLPISNNEIMIALKKKGLTPTTLFMRFYQKWEDKYEVHSSNHNGMNLRSNYPGAGIKPPTNGTGGFSFTLQNNIEGELMTGEAPPGYTHIYAYWPKQNSNYGDHWYPTGMVKPKPSQWLTYPAQYPGFKVMPNFLPQRGRWYCYEMMLKLNTVGQKDGEVKVWIDGKVVADFPNLFIRSLDTIKIQEAHVVLGANANPKRVNKKWYDNIVIAKKYIGPMQP